MTKENCRRINMKRKCFAKGKGQRFKRFKRTPKFIKDNIENQIAREKDVYEFSDSEDDERANELGMGIDFSDLALLENDNLDLDAQKAMIAITQDTVAPLFRDEQEYDEQKLNDALVELKYLFFRPNQQETIKRILMGRSTLFISPTGSGKSLCYQIPALLYWRFRRYITIVVSPLISLMEDQIRNMPSSVKPVAIHSGLNKQQRQNAISQLVNGEAQVAFLTPEAIVSGLLEINDLKNLPAVGFVCIDEAHCLSEWSHNFRPAYMQFMRILNEKLNIKTFLALTATATKATTFGIAKCLRINPETDVIGCTTIPDNLILSISHEENKQRAIIDLLKSPTFRIMPSIIVYCNRQRETEKVASIIRTAMQNYSTLVDAPQRKRNDQPSSNNDDSSPEAKPKIKLSWDAQAYHAGLPSSIRMGIQKQFIRGEIRVVVATIAFGMGINKSDIRAIIHYDMPSSFESYVQEIGRAGRDGKPAQCHMFLKSDKSDVHYHQRFVYSSVTETSGLDKLVNYIFPSCRCEKLASKADIVKLDSLNSSDPHEVRSWNKGFANTTVSCTEEDSDDEQEFATEGTIAKENRPAKYIFKSVIRKHRACKGHEVAFSVDEATNEINLFSEAIMTYIYYLDQAYPQLQIKQFPPTKPICSLSCYKGPEQLSRLAENCPAVREGLFFFKQEYLKKHGTQVPFELPKKINFDVTKVAQRLAKSSAEVIKMLKRIEWELNDKTGKFQRTHARVNFEGNSFHLSTVCDLSPNELKEITKFLRVRMTEYERIERQRMIKIYKTFGKHSIDIDQMKDKIVRLKTSIQLKKTLNDHFNPSDGLNVFEELGDSEANSEDDSPFPLVVRDSIQKKLREFISTYGRDFKPRTIAKIFQGISCPNYPADQWGTNFNFWKSFPDVNFLKLIDLISQYFINNQV